jgi:hypothetical protein
MIVVGAKSYVLLIMRSYLSDTILPMFHPEGRENHHLQRSATSIFYDQSGGTAPI